ncbi:hypothetical protein PIROE2DRAFT_16713 [Piromyces sp. E2]|nr:hypothetical protein PIROE2DRAFT_16713 [Piromyces sp. E2]|eukprot:OUM58101.1 hypothetical protein PIROE2DRAFT_16713 [Piromyces sp. E2]
MPVTNNGKLDRRALPEPNINDLIKEEYIAPETETEKEICSIFSQIFKIDVNEIGKKSNFYDLGGDSLNAISIASHIEKKLNVKINIKSIMNHPVVSDISEYIDSLMKDCDISHQVEVIEKRNSKEFPVTSQQLGVYIDSIKNNNNILYNVPMTFKLREDVDIERIKEGFNQLFEKYQILKSKYLKKEVDGKTEIYGYIDDECKLVFEEYTNENVSSFVRPFDLSSAPLIRVGFIGNEVLLIDMHHIISDGTTIKIVIDELNKYYNDGSMSESEIQFGDYAYYINEKMKSGFYNDQIEFYKNMFNEEYDILKFNNMNENNENESEIQNITREIDVSISKGINKFVKQYNVSKTAFFLSIYGYVLSKYSGQETVYSSIISANRNNHYLENMIGMFVSTQPILLKFEENDNHSFVEVIKENMTTLMNMYNYQDLSLSELIKCLKLKNVNNTFIYQPKSIINSTSSLSKSIVNNDGINEEMLSLYENNETKFDITFNLVEKEDEYLISVDYNTEYFSTYFMEKIVNSFIEMARNVEKFEKMVCEIEYIPTEEKEKIINKFNENRFEYPQDKLYHTEFSKLAQEIPDKCAIVCNDVEITYRELDEMSNSLAHYLRSKGIGRGNIVPIISERSQYFIIAALAIMKSGACYLPVDPEFPYERIQYMIDECQSKLVLKYITNEEVDNKLKFEGIEEYQLQGHDYSKCTEGIDNVNEGNDTSYIIFTSGTTGKPKGTIISHANLVNYCLYSQKYMGKTDIYSKGFDCALAICKFTHDISISEINYPLLRGCKIVLSNDDEFNNPKLIGKLIRKHQINYIFSVPSRIVTYLNEPEFADAVNDNVKYLIFGGEKFNTNLLKVVERNHNIQLLNVYGPSETTVVSSMKNLTEEVIKNGGSIENILISTGKPLCNFNTYILDKYLKPVPIGVVGEIVLGGTNNKMYRTGDVGNWNEEGEVVCVGRIDFQVKIRGQRIELSEIESTIKEIEGIKDSIVLNKEKENGEQYLVGYYINSNEGSEGISGSEIRNYLKQKLPHYMIPSYFISIKEIPLTNNGKADRRALPEPSINDMIKEEYVAPETETEKEICNIFSQIFKIDVNEIGRMSNFYDLGGDSLNAISILSMIEKEFNVKIKFKEFMKHSVVNELASYIDSIVGNEDNIHQIDIIEKRNSKEFPVTSQQLGVYIDSIKNSNTIIYNVPMTFKLKKNVNIEKIKEAFEKLFLENDILRTKYYGKEINGKTKIYGIVDDECQLKFENYTYENANSFVRPFDLSSAPLIRVGFIGSEVLMFDMHHIITDGYTTKIIINEIDKYYNEGTFNEKEIQFSDYALYLNDKLNSGYYQKQIEFYKEMFKSDYETLNIPTKKEKEMKNNEEEMEININTCSSVISEELSNTINKFIKQNEISKVAFFLSIYGYVLSKYSGQENIYSSIISANRNNHYLENMIGMFVSTQPILLKYEENDKHSLIECMKENMNILVNMYSNQDLSLSEIAKSLKLKKLNNIFIYQPKSIVNVSSSVNNSIIENNEENNEILSSYLEMIRNINNFENKLSNIEYIPKEERETIINSFNDNCIEYQQDMLYHTEFSKLAQEIPDQCAIVYEEKEISYKELDEMSNSIAHFLRKQGVKRGEVIPIISERSYYYVIGIIGVMKSGGAYLPIDPEFPKDRIEYMIEEVNAKRVLKYITDVKNNEKMELDNKSIEVYSLEHHNYSENTEEIENVNESDDLCYILFTSGTTGKPKGTMIAHSNLINDCLYCKEYMHKQGFKSYLSFSKFTFDMSIDEINFPLLRGSKIVLCNDEEFNNPMKIGKLIKEHDIGSLLIVPSRFENYMNNDEFYESINNIKLINVNESDDLCYILFTSGTTGKPKGTMIAHSNLINDCLYCKEYMHKQGFKSYLSFSKFTFDMSIDEINFPLLRGSKIVLCNDEEFNNPMKIGKLIKEHDIGSLLIVPSRFENYMNNDEFYESINNIKLIVFGGEKLSAKLLENIYERFDLTIYNGYGPTETTASCTYKKILPDEIKDGNKELMISIGKPLRNCRMYILDKNMKPVPIGIEGEIFIGGYGVGKGYLNRPELTQEKFVVNPFVNDEGNGRNVMYRTGDLGKWTEEGEIICLGRIDFQVKIRGQRIELSEIENTINEINEIDSSLVIDKLSADSNNKYLVCYYIVKEGNEIEGREIRNYLKSKLPNYMIPSYFKRIYELPVTSNGKLDRKRLPEPDNDDLITEAYVAPETETEKKLCRIFSSIFKIDVNKIGKMSNFYDLGGDSLNAIKCTAMIRKIFKVSILIKDLINNAVLTDLAMFIDNKIENNINNNYGDIIKNNSSLEYPVENLFGMVTTENGNLNFDAFSKITNNLSVIYKLNVPISIEKLNGMFNIIIERHNALRSVFFAKTVNGKKKLYGRVRDNVKLEIERYDITNFYKFSRPFDVSKDLLIRVGLIDEKILMIEMSHNVSDGFSFSVLFNELYQLYYGDPLEDLPIQVNDYYNHCFNNNEKINGKGLEFYREMFSEKFDVVNIPKKPIEKQIKYDSRIIELKKIHNPTKYEIMIMNTDNEIYNSVNRIIRKNNLSKSAFFFAIYSFILGVYSGQRKIYNHIAIANRMNDDIRKLIGFFINIVPVLVKIENVSFIDYIKQVTNVYMNVINLHIPYEILTDELNLPLYTSLFKFDPYEMVSNDDFAEFADIIDETEIYKIYGREDLISTNMKPKLENKFYHDFLFEVAEGKDSYCFQLLYKCSVFDRELMKEMMNSLLSLIVNEEYLYENVDKLFMDSKKFLDKIDPINEFLIQGFNNEFDMMEYEQSLKASNCDDQEYTKDLNDKSKLIEEDCISTNKQDTNAILIDNSTQEKQTIFITEKEDNKNSIQEQNKSKITKKDKTNKVKYVLMKIIKSIKKKFQNK